MLSWKNKKLDQVDRVKLLRNAGSYTLLILAGLALVFFGMCQPNDPSGASLSGAAGKVNGEEITKFEFMRAYQRQVETLRQRYQEGFDPAAMQLANRVLQGLASDRLIYQMATEMGLKATDDEIMTLLIREKAFSGPDGKFSEEVFERSLKGNRYTEATFLDEQRRMLTVQKLRQFILETNFVSEKSLQLDQRLSESKAEIDFVKIDPATLKLDIVQADVAKFLDEAGKAKVKEYYEKHPAEFNQAAQIRARHVLVSFQGARNAAGAGATRTKEAAKKLADQVAEKAKSGADFAGLAKEFTDEPVGKTRGGDLGLFTKEAMVKEFSDAAFALKAGEVSGVVETPFGFHVIKVDETKPEKKVTLEAATDGIARILMERDRKPALAQERANQIQKAWAGGASIDSLLKEFGLKVETTGSFSLSAPTIPGLGAEKPLREAALTLVQPGQVAGSVLEARGSKFVLKLKSRSVPAEQPLAADRRRQLEEMAQYYQGASYVQMLDKRVQDQIRDRKRVSLNAEYLAIDQPAARGDASGNDQGG